MDLTESPHYDIIIFVLERERERENLEPDWIADIHVVTGSGGSVVQEQWRAVGKGVSRSPGLMGRVSVREPWNEDSPSTETLACLSTVPIQYNMLASGSITFTHINEQLSAYANESGW